MMFAGDHVPDRDLLRFMDGELTPSQAETIREHLEYCEACRSRRAALANSSKEFEDELRKLVLPSADASRAALLKNLRHDAAQSDSTRALWTAAAGIAVAAAMGIAWRAGSPQLTVEAAFAPNASLTPGATRSISREAMCSAEQDRPELRHIANDVAQQVFRRYGIDSPKPRTYEIDYLIPPDLGGSEDPRNLWPEPYARGVWNARVKDALEDRLRSMVCDGKLDLATAQRELARDWIGAYKRYFSTDKPLLDHVAFNKDSPWE